MILSVPNNLPRVSKNKQNQILTNRMIINQALFLKRLTFRLYTRLLNKIYKKKTLDFQIDRPVYLGQVRKNTRSPLLRR